MTAATARPERRKVVQTVVNGRPPVYDRIVAAIGEPPEGAVFTYGDAIYVPSGEPLSPDVRIHEAVHMLQQEDAGGPEAWWGRYLVEPAWRAGQELEAYRTQFGFARAAMPDRNAQARFRRSLASFLAGPMYGRCIDFQAAYVGIGRQA